MQKNPVQILYFKKNLRTIDNEILEKYDPNLPTLGVYFFEKSIMNLPDFSDFHLQFILDSLQNLEKNLQKIGIPLIFVESEAVEGFSRLHKVMPIKTIFSHEETGNWETFMRDKAIIEWAKNEKIPFTEFPTNGVVRRLKNRDQWNKIWKKRIEETAIFDANICKNPFEVPEKWKKYSLSVFQKYENSFLKNSHLQRGGEDTGKQILQDFLKNRCQKYSYHISKPNEGEYSCSRLSPFLAYGCLSLKYVFQKTKEQQELYRKSSDENQKKTHQTIAIFCIATSLAIAFYTKIRRRADYGI